MLALCDRVIGRLPTTAERHEQHDLVVGQLRLAGRQCSVGTSQRALVDFGEVSYVHDVARARTFGFMQDVESLRGMGLARGGSLENAIVMDEYRILNSDGLRYDDEFVRHKILDAIGDLYLVGHPLLASYTAHKSGHAMNNLLLLELLKHPEAYEIVAFEEELSAPPSYVRQMAREWALT